VDDKDGTWENPYFGFGITVPQAEVLWKRVMLIPLTEEEGTVLDKVIIRLAKFIEPTEERREGREKLRALGMLLSMPREEGDG